MIRRFTVAVAFFVLVAGTARANHAPGHYPHEVLLNPNSFVLPVTPGTSGAFAFNVGTLINFSAGYLYSLTQNLALGFYPGISYYSAGVAGSATLLTLVAGPTLNIPCSGNDIHDAFFVTGAAGITHVSGAGNGTKFTLRGDLGKRFKIFEHVTYRPSAGIYWVDGSTVAFVFNVLGASIVF